MPVTIRVHLAEKRSTTSQYENRTIGADIEAAGLELHSAEEIRDKTRELLLVARSAIQSQLLEPPVTVAQNGNGREQPRNGHEGARRALGRPTPEPTAKQKQFLRQIARERNLDAETVGEICERLVGVPLRACTRDDLSRLIDALIEEAA